MAMRNEVIDEIKPHTEKKIELISRYVKGWAWKVLNFSGNDGFPKNQGIVFIDCMSNSGTYRRKGTNELIEGTALRVVKILEEIMSHFPEKKAYLFFNDFNEVKINYLEESIEKIHCKNLSITTSIKDRNVFLEEFPLQKFTHYQKLLIYDPYKTDIFWKPLIPFLNVWGEVIMNHMLYDVTTGIKNAKGIDALDRYEESYQMKTEEIRRIHTDRDQLNNRIMEIIKSNHYGSGEYYLTYASFYNRRHGEVYRLIHCTQSISGSILFKKTAWNVFDGKSSEKGRKIADGQLMLNFEDATIEMRDSEENCFTISDIANHIYKEYIARGELSERTIFDQLAKHPIFPTEGYIRDIKKALRIQHHIKCKNGFFEYMEK